MRLFSTLLLALLAFIPARADDAAETNADPAASESPLDAFLRGYNAARLDAALAANDYNTALYCILNSLPDDRGSYRSLETTNARIRVLTAHMDKAPPLLKSMLAVVIAQTAALCVKDNHSFISSDGRWKNTSADFLEWDNPRILKKIFSLGEIALADPALLRRTPINAFGSVLTTEDASSDSLRPTLYDFIVHRLIECYNLGHADNDAYEDSPNRADNESPWASFDPDANSPLLGTLEEFLAWNPAAEQEISADALPALLRAVALYQEFLRFRLADTANPAALADADLARILWAKEILPDDEYTRTRFQQTLRAFATRREKYTPAAAALAELARSLNEQAKNPRQLRHEPSVPVPLDALKIAARGLALHPGSTGSRRCAAIIAEIQDPELKLLTTETVWNAPLPGITVRYRNLPKVHFRIVPADWKETLEYRETQRPESPGAAKFAALLKSTPVQAWSSELPATPDHAIHAHTDAAPNALAPGFYHLLVSANGDFSTKGNTLLHTTFWVSELAVVFGLNAILQADNTSKYQIQGHVLNAVTGAPVPGATVSAWHRRKLQKKDLIQEIKLDKDERTAHPDIEGFDNSANNRKSILLPHATTDADGGFTIGFPVGNADMESFGEPVVLFAETPDGQRLSVADTVSSFLNENLDDNQLHIRFFTDRTIYRPGQTLHFKGLAFSAKHRTKTYVPRSAVPLTVLLKDPENKEAARLTLTPDSTGSFSGNFVLPNGKLTGHYTLTSDEKNCEDHVRISVEEYKHPKFEVMLNAPEFLQTSGRAVTLTGTARSTNGSPVDGAQVKWKVHADNSYHNKKKIARGTASTDSAGNFTVTFFAPRKTVHALPFNFVVTVEVTDSTGETRNTLCRIASEAPTSEIEIHVDEWQEAGRAVTLGINNDSASDNPPQPGTAGTLTIHPLRQPEKVLRKNLENFYGFRNDLCTGKDPADPDNWEKLPAVFTAPLVLRANEYTPVQANLPEGIYRAVFTKKNSTGAPVRVEKRFNVYAPAATQCAIRLPFMVAVQKADNSLQPGDTFSALWSSGYTNARALISIEHQGKILRRFWTNPEHTQERITLPVTESLRGGFTLRVLQMRENHFHHESCIINVPWENKNLKIRTERFRTRLTPGAHETWILKIKPAQPEDSAFASSQLQLTAVLYDASLDSFRAHKWSTLSDIFYRESPFYSLSWQSPLRDGDPKIEKLVDSSNRFPVGARDEYRTWKHGLAPFFWGPGRGGRSFSVSSGVPEYVEEYASADFAGEKDTAAIAATFPRRNFTETAFFFPSLSADPDGTVRLEFTVPKGITRWKFLAFAHDAALRSGAVYNDTITTSKDFPVQPKPAR